MIDLIIEVLFIVETIIVIMCAQRIRSQDAHIAQYKQKAKDRGGR